MAEPDDDASSLASKFHAGGYSTVAVRSGAQVFGRARGEEFDHMVTPYHLEELLARVRARLRHVGSSAPDVLSVGDVHLDRSARQCTTCGASSVPTSSTRCEASVIAWVHDRRGVASDT